RAEPGPKPVAASVLDASHSWIVVPGPGSTEFTGDVSDVLTLVVEATADGGVTWQRELVPGSYPGTSQVLVFVDSSHGFLLAASERHSPIISTVLKTDDGGATWAVAGRLHGLGSV